VVHEERNVEFERAVTILTEVPPLFDNYRQRHRIADGRWPQATSILMKRR
jgi:hypothetical protein